MGMQLNRDKRIGRVIFFVEGSVDEPTMLRRIFCDVLGYTLTDASGLTCFRSKSDPYSSVFVIPMPSSAIANIPGDEAFLDEVYQRLKEHGLESDEASVFYLFDRDRQSDKANAVESKISLLKNPLDNGEELPGALLLSYPCLQAYYCQAHGDLICVKKAKELKAYVNARNYVCLAENSVLLAAEAMLILLAECLDKPFDLSDLDDYSIINSGVFAFEEDYWSKNNKTYKTISLLSLAFLDLGLLSMD